MRALVLCVAVGSLAAACTGAQRRSEPSQLSAACDRIGDADVQVAHFLAPGNAHAVEPIYRREFVVRAYQPRRLVGAVVHVPAPPNVSEAYFERALTCHARTTSTSVDHAHDPLRVAGVRNVDVESHGPTFRVSIYGEERDSSRAILERARILQEMRGQVTVRQLASRSTANSL